MDTLTAEETEAFYNDIALPPIPLTGGFDPSARGPSPSYPSQIDFLLQTSNNETPSTKEVHQHGTHTGSGGSSSTPSDKQNSTLPDRSRSPLYGSGTSSSPTQTCSTSTSYTGSAATITSNPAGSVAGYPPLQQQQQRQGNLAVKEANLSSSAASMLETPAAGLAAAGEPAGAAVPGAGALTASTRDTEDPPSRTVNLYDDQGMQNPGGISGGFVPAISQTTAAALPRGALDSSGRAGGRAARGYGSSEGRAAGGRDVLPFAASQRPPTGAVAVDRVERNVRFFFMNYALLCGALALLAIIANPAILVVGAVFGGAAAAAGLHGGSTIRVGENTIVPVKNIRYICGAAGLFTLLFVAGQLVVGLLAVSAVFILLHAALHVGVSYEKIAQHCADEFDCSV